MSSSPPLFSNKTGFSSRIQKWKQDIVPETIPVKARMLLMGSVLRGLGDGITMTAQKLGSAFSTWFGSWLITSYSINAPIYVGAVLYIAYSVSMYSLFGGIAMKTQDASQQNIIEVQKND